MAGGYYVNAELTPKGEQIAAARRDFVQGLLDWLRVKYPRQTVHVWVNNAYLGLYVWGLAMHWRWGYSGMSHEELKAAINSAPTVRLASEKPLPEFSGLDDASTTLRYYSA